MHGVIVEKLYHGIFKITVTAIENENQTVSLLWNAKVTLEAWQGGMARTNEGDKKQSIILNNNQNQTISFKI